MFGQCVVTLVVGMAVAVIVKTLSNIPQMKVARPNSRQK